MADLKPCPFCGEPVEPWNWLVDGCSSHGCACYDMARDGCTTVAKWNRRAPSPAVREVVNRFKALSRWPSFKMRYPKLYAALERLAKEIEA